MTWDTVDQSQRDGKKVFLYRFTWGGRTARYTNAETNVAFAGNTWISETITHSDVSRTLEDDGDKIEITLPSTNQVAQLFIGIPPTRGVACRVSSFHRTDGALEERLEWEGVIRVGTANRELQSVLTGKTFVADFSKQIPLDTFQGPCNNFLYDEQCKVNELTFTHSLQILSISGLEYTITGLSAASGADPDYFVGGFVDFDGGEEQRMILAQSGDVATLMFPFSDAVQGGATVAVKAGCDHTLATCDSKFSNAQNYGGCPFIPTKDIYRSGVQ